MKLVRKLLKLKTSRSGATAIEYALIAGLICLAIVGGVSATGESTNAAFVRVNDGVWGS